MFHAKKNHREWIPGIPVGFKPWSSQVVVGDHTGTITLRAPDPQAISRVCIGDMSGALIVGKFRFQELWDDLNFENLYMANKLLKTHEKSVLLELSRSWGCFHGAALLCFALQVELCKPGAVLHIENAQIATQQSAGFAGQSAPTKFPALLRDRSDTLW